MDFNELKSKIANKEIAIFIDTTDSEIIGAILCNFYNAKQIFKTIEHLKNMFIVTNYFQCNRFGYLIDVSVGEYTPTIKASDVYSIILKQRTLEALDIETADAHEHEHELKPETIEETFRPIAMRCTQEQFDAIKPKLVHLKIICIDSFVTYGYLVNNLSDTPFFISNICETDKMSYKRKVYEEWNEKIFLKACGIEVETMETLDKKDWPVKECQEPLIDRLTDEVVSPARYSQYRIETIEMMRRIWGNDAVRLWAEMTAFKYRMRLGHKDETDLELAKENWYLAYSKTIFQDESRN